MKWLKWLLDVLIPVLGGLFLIPLYAREGEGARLLFFSLSGVIVIGLLAFLALWLVFLVIPKQKLPVGSAALHSLLIVVGLFIGNYFSPLIYG